MYTRTGGGMSAFSFILAGLFLSAAAPAAHAQQGADLERIARCSRDLCDILRAPFKDGGPLQCEVGKTLYKEQIDKAMRARKLMWPLGDARCTVKLDIDRAILTRAMTQDRHTLKLPKQPADCDVEYKGTHYPVTLSLAPEFEFRNGRATSVLLGVQDIEATVVLKALIWSAARLEDNIGVFQEDFVRGLNSYIQSTCKARPAVRRQVRAESGRVR